MKQIPNLFTLLNLVLGCLAIVFILQTGESLVFTNEEGAWVPQLPEKIGWGALCIGLAAIVDFLDGFIARLFKAGSEMGKQLDSLADIVSFGVAPGLILYQLLRISYIGEETGLDTSLWAFAPALLFPCAGAWRLARFNTENNTGNDFKGVPIPAAGLVVASFPLILFHNYFDIGSLLINKWFLYGTIVLLSYLMISTRSFLAFKAGGLSPRKNPAVLILAVAGLAAAVFLQWLAVPVVFICYIMLSLILKKQTK